MIETTVHVAGTVGMGDEVTTHTKRARAMVEQVSSKSKGSADICVD